MLKFDLVLNKKTMSWSSLRTGGQATHLLLNSKSQRPGAETTWHQLHSLNAPHLLLFSPTNSLVIPKFLNWNTVWQILSLTHTLVFVACQYMLVLSSQAGPEIFIYIQTDILQHSLCTDVLPRHYQAVANTHQLEPGEFPQHWHCLQATDTSPSEKTNVYPINMSKYHRIWHSTSSTILRRPGTAGRDDSSLHRRQLRTQGNTELQNY